jgi:hypothetical protein
MKFFLQHLFSIMEQMRFDMKKQLSLLFILGIQLLVWSQTKVSGIVLDQKKRPVGYASVAFKGTTEGVITNEDGRFYLESTQVRKILSISFAGYNDVEIDLTKTVNYEMKIVLFPEESLKEVKIYAGKMSKKNNPAIDILRKIWARKRKNGLRMFNQYAIDKYEKVEFDMNTIDSAFMKNRLFRGMEFIFKQIDTSKITGKTYLPIFINESISTVYGDNKLNKKKEILKGNKNSGLGNSQGIDSFIKDLYTEYDIYDNYITFFDKTFTSPLSRTGIDVYNYVLADSSFIKNKWCYNIVFYPRRKNELTFKGDFWVNDTTWAIKNINMAVTKSANINWVKDIYVEQEFDVLNDSVFLLDRDYVMTDFALNKKEKSKGVYGKRTTMYKNHEFNKPKPDDFYKEEVNYIDEEAYKKPDEFWESNRFEKLNKDEKGIYKMLDTLKTVKKFKQIYSVVQILGTGYYRFDGFDYGPLFSTIGFNEIEGFRLRVGGRTFFQRNDPWRIQGYTAYGFKDQKFKYGISGKWLVGKKNRVILSIGNRQDVEQLGASLTTTNDVLGRSFASSALFTAGSNFSLTNINLTSFSLDIEPLKNFNIEVGFNYRALKSASPKFSLDYYTQLPDNLGNPGIIKSTTNQAEANLLLDYTPGRKAIGTGVERTFVDAPYSRFFVNFSQGLKGILNSDFSYSKIQFFYKKPLIIGGIGRLNIITELGQTFGKVPLGLMSIIPGNQTYFTIENTFNTLNFYEFESDRYATISLQHNFGGRIFSRIPYLRKLNWRETIGIKGVYGTITDENRAINATNIIYRAPEQGFWEYNAGIGNIFKVFRIECSWRGTYITPQTTNFAIKGSFGFYF